MEADPAEESPDRAELWSAAMAVARLDGGKVKRRMAASSREEHDRLGALTNCEYLSNVTGAPLHEGILSEAFYALVDAKAPAMRFHDTRHSRGALLPVAER
jgi:hypothetical protein